MRPGRVQHHAFHDVGQRREEGLEAEYQGVVERVALLGPRQREQRDIAAQLRAQRRRQLDRKAGRSPCHGGVSDPGV
jgi:hypothetical protein